MRYRRRAMIIAMSYLLIGGIYILVSDHLAAFFSPTMVELEIIQRYKGIAFIVVTAMGLYWFSWVNLRQVISDAVRLLENRTALFSSERKALAAFFSVSVSEEIRKDIDPVRGAAGTQALQDLAAALERVGVSHLQGEKRIVELCSLVQSSVEIARGYMLPGNRCEIKVSPCRQIKVLVYPALIHQMLVNLLMNAVEAVKAKGRIRVDFHAAERGIVLEVHDSGPGIPPEKWEAVLSPFYSTKHEGMGFGLLAVKACAAAHGAKVEVSHSDLGGARIDVVFPLSISK